MLFSLFWLMTELFVVCSMLISMLWEKGSYILVASCTVRFLIVNMLAIDLQNPDRQQHISMDLTPSKVHLITGVGGGAAANCRPLYTTDTTAAVLHPCTHTYTDMLVPTPVAVCLLHTLMHSNMYKPGSTVRIRRLMKTQKCFNFFQ